MEIVVNNKTLKIEKNVILFGKNGEDKASFINKLIEGLQGKNKNLVINGRKNATNDYKIIILNEETDFEKEFKFTKNNTLKQLIYNDEISKINEKKLINYANELFNSVDIKINNLLDKKINKNEKDTLKMDIEIPDINSIIDKFTNIYIDNKLINDASISKAMKRKLLYQLYFLDIKNNPNQEYIIVLNNFDAYLSNDETIEILEKIEKLSNLNCHFILTTSNDIFDCINLDVFNIYKIGKQIFSFDIIKSSIEKYLKNKIGNITITDDEITSIYDQLLNKNSHIISKILNSNEMYFLLNKPKKIKKNYAICSSKEEKQIFETIFNNFID